MKTDDLMRRLSEKKARSLEDLERWRKEALVRIDARIDELYRQRDMLSQVLKKRLEYGRHKVGVWKAFWRRSLKWNTRYILSMPFIYGMILPAFILHAGIELYQHVCFRLYGIPLVKPNGYFIYDRRLLPYLNWLEKVNCFYCSYFNGLIAYAMEIAGRTERYWCPIKHARRRMVQHSQYAKFVDYDDAEHVREEWERLRKFTNIQE